MSTLSIRDQRFAGATMLPDDFVDYYLPRANGDFVKIYLYLLRSVHAQAATPTITSLADVFALTERDVTRALQYWQEVGLLELKYKDDDLEEIVLLPVSQKLKETQNDPGAAVPLSEAPAPEQSLLQVSTSRLKELRAQEETKQDIRSILFITQQYLGHPLSSTDIRRISYLYDELHMSVDLIDYLVEYCVTRGGASINYIMKVGLAWYEEGLRSVKEAKARNNQSMKNYYTIFKFFGITGRSPVPGEINDMDRWINEYKFPMTIIEEAATRTIRSTGKPSFPYAERILSDWHAAGVRRASDIATLDAQHKTAQEEQRKSGAKGGAGAAKKPTPGKFGNFPQRDDDTHRKLVEEIIRKQ